MCWSASASVAMVGFGGAAVAITALRGEPRAIWLTLGYFTVMEGLQALGYTFVDQCGTTANKTVTLLSYLHIAFQPLVINAFAIAIAPQQVPIRIQRRVYGVAALCSGLILFRLAPVDWAGLCRVGEIMCSTQLCTVSGNWHIAWELPLNGLYNPLNDWLGTQLQFPDYLSVVFLLPLFYGAWRFVLFHLTAGPVLAGLLTSNPDEIPAVWCLFSIGILLISLSPFVRYTVFGAHRLSPA